MTNAPTERLPHLKFCKVVSGGVYTYLPRFHSAGLVDLIICVDTRKSGLAGGNVEGMTDDIEEGEEEHRNGFRFAETTPPVAVLGCRNGVTTM